jgi:hypothetical protein
MAAVRCIACRTCVQTNLIVSGLAAAIAVGASLGRFGRRLFGRLLARVGNASGQSAVAAARSASALWTFR